MMFRSKLAAFAGALLLAGSAFSGQQVACPDINDIKAEGLTMAEPIGPSMYVSYNISAYNTASNWGFVIGPVEGESSDEAIESANDVLSTMSAPGVPQQYDIDVCTYDTGSQNLIAAAIKDESQITPMKLKQYIKKFH